MAELSRRAAIISPNHQRLGGGAVGLRAGCGCAFFFEIVPLWPLLLKVRFDFTSTAIYGRPIDFVPLLHIILLQCH